MSNAEILRQRGRDRVSTVTLAYLLGISKRDLEDTLFDYPDAVDEDGCVSLGVAVRLLEESQA